MVSQSRDLQFFKTTVLKVEKINKTLRELFSNSSNEDGMLSYRASTLQQFAILASAYHQTNTIDFLQNSETISHLFNKEINIAHYRTKDYEHNAIKTINENLKHLEEYLSQMVDLLGDLEQLEITSNSYINLFDHSYYENILQSLLFYLQEIKSRIILPASTIIDAEIHAAEKLLEVMQLRESNSKEVSTEEIARMCEVMSWGLESPPGWKSIQSETTELSGDLEKKLGSLRALVTTYYQ